MPPLGVYMGQGGSLGALGGCGPPMAIGRGVIGRHWHISVETGSKPRAAYPSRLVFPRVISAITYPENRLWVLRALSLALELWGSGGVFQTAKVFLKTNPPGTGLYSR